MQLSRTQEKAIIDIHRDASGFPGVSIRQPTIQALIRMGYVYAEDFENEKRVGTMYKLTALGEDRAKALLEGASNRLPDEPDPYENWESYDLD